MGKVIKAPDGKIIGELVEEGGSKVERDFCPECQKKDMMAELMKRDHRQELEKVEATIAKLQEQLSGAKAMHTRLDGAWAEAENCPNCKPIRDGIVRQIAEATKNALTADDLNAHLVGDWLKRKNLISVLPDDKGKYEEIKSIEVK